MSQEQDDFTIGDAYARLVASLAYYPDQVDLTEEEAAAILEAHGKTMADLSRDCNELQAIEAKEQFSALAFHARVSRAREVAYQSATAASRLPV